MTDARRTRQILDVIRSLGPGEVVSYGDVAADAGAPGCARLVGRLLAAHADEELPWWRVVTSAGRLVPGHEAEHAAVLIEEGVTVVGGRVRAAPAGRFSRSIR